MKRPLLAGPGRDLILNYLKANMNSALGDDDIVRNDGITLGSVDQKCFYISEIFQTLKCPACYVLVDDMKFDYTTEQNYIQGSYGLRIIMTAEDVGGDVLQKKVESYSRVLFNLLDQKELLTTDGRLKVQLVSSAIEFGDIIMRNETPDRKKYRRDCVYTWKVFHVENRLIP